MSLSDRVKSIMDVVLEEVCQGLPNGGAHDVRRMIAERLLEAAEAGHHSLEQLRAVGERAFSEVVQRSRRQG